MQNNAEAERTSIDRRALPSCNHDHSLALLQTVITRLCVWMVWTAQPYRMDRSIRTLNAGLQTQGGLLLAIPNRSGPDSPSIISSTPFGHYHASK